VCFRIYVHADQSASSETSAWRNRSFAARTQLMCVSVRASDRTVIKVKVGSISAVQLSPTDNATRLVDDWRELERVRLGEDRRLDRLDDGVDLLTKPVLALVTATGHALNDACIDKEYVDLYHDSSVEYLA
jgi:hypothetical protein